MNRLLLTIIAVLSAIVSYAQDDITDSIKIRLPDINNEADRRLLQQRAKECVKQMNDYITSMTATPVNGHPTVKDRYKFRKAALSLFLGNGDSIVLTNGVKTSPVMMETTSINSSGKKIKTTRPVKVYFDRLISLIAKGTYTDVKITSTNIEGMTVTKLEPDEHGRYQCVVAYSQDFIGRRGEIKVYADRTKKTITVYFVKEKTVIGEELVPKLGDIAAGETKRL